MMNHKYTRKLTACFLPILIFSLCLTGCSSLQKQPTDTAADDPLLLVGTQKIIAVSPDEDTSVLYEKAEKESILQAVMGENDILYVATTDDPYNYEENMAHLFAIDDGYIQPIDDVPNNSLQLDFYDGSLFVQYYDIIGDEYVNSLVDYSPTEDGSYEKGSRYQNLFDSLKAADYDAISGLIYSLNKDQQVIAVSDQTVAGFDTQGNQLWETVLLQEASSVFAANTHYVLYVYNEWFDKTDDTPSHYIQNCILHDIQTGEEQTISVWNSVSNDPQTVFISLEEDVFYYYEHFTENGLEQDHIYQYDLSTNERAFLYETSAMPGPGGRHEITPGVTDFHRYQDQLYYRSVADDSIGWTVFDPSTGKQNPLSVIDEERTFAQYGSIFCEGDHIQYDKWKMDIYDYYIECFQFNDSFAQSSSLNETLKSIYENFSSYVEQTAESERSLIAESDPSEIYADIYPYTYDMYIDQVMKIGSHYFTVDYTGYEYWGGAHGYPYREHYLFDLDTGSLLTINDIYSGSEETFKEVVATYSVKHWKENSEIYFFDPATEENVVYQDFFDNARLDMLIRFKEKNLVIEYSPYEYGPYAAGFIEVEIPYEALDISLE